MWKQKNKQEDERFEPVECPVCEAALGRRNIEKIFLAHCEECKATFHWKRGVDKPSVTMDKDAVKLKRYCDRDGCRCR